MNVIIVKLQNILILLMSSMIMQRELYLDLKYNDYLTKHEDQFQYFLQVVKDHRHKFVNAKKYALKKNSNK